jgi:hypothetical protein
MPLNPFDKKPPDALNEPFITKFPLKGNSGEAIGSEALSGILRSGEVWWFAL